MTDETDEKPGADRTRSAIGIVATQHAASVRARLKAMKQDESADLVNALAWWDENPLDLHLRRGRRGEVTHLSARLLEIDATPNLAPAPTADRAVAFLQPGGLGHDLLALCGSDQLVLARVEPNDAQGRIFVFEQSFAGFAVRDARAFVELDARGRLTRLDSTLVPCVKASTNLRVSRGQALKIARDDLQGSKDPLWIDVKPHLAEAGLIIVNTFGLDPDPGLDPDECDADRLAWAVWFTAPPNKFGGHREVLVDALDGEVIASVEHTKFFDAGDRVYRLEGTIGESEHHVYRPRLWSGDMPCDAPSPVPLDDPVLERDLEETKLALCAAEDLIAEAGAPLGRPALRDWIHGTRPFAFGIGADPGISIAQNSGATVEGTFVHALAFAHGAARADSVGHELGHTLYASASLATRDLDPSRSSNIERAGIEEHMCDVFGKLLDARMPDGGELCTLSGDADTRDTIATAQSETRDCSLLNRALPWRWFCNPEMDNGGWCEGATRTLDLAYGPYDAYSRMHTTALDAYVAGHTNLGVGNRAVAALFRDPAESPSRFDGFRIPGIGRSAVETLYLRALTHFRGQPDWTGYSSAWRAAAVSAFGTGMSAPEQAIRTAHAAASIWSERRSVVTETAPATLEVLPSPDPRFRPAAASLVLSSGVERTFVFYRPDVSSQRVEYVWRDEPRGGEHAEAPTPFSGPCVLPGAFTSGSPTAAGRDDALFVIWSEPTATPGIGRLRGASLSPAELETEGGCITGWADEEPGAERLLRGSPAVAVWEPDAIEIDCGVLAATFGPIFPFQTMGSMGLKIGDCFEVGERIPPRLLSPNLGPQLLEILRNLLDSKAVLGNPSLVDPRAPLRDFEKSLVRHGVDLLPLLAERQKERQELMQLADGVGKLVDVALQRAGRASSLGLRFVFEHEPFGDDAWMGTARSISLRFANRRLIVAFRDPAGALRIVDYDDVRATDGADPIPTLDSSPNATDPALATVDGEISEDGVNFTAQLLYALYGTSERIGGRDVPTRLSYRAALTIQPGDALTNDVFEPARRIDTLNGTRGVRRKVDYAYARTRRAPVAVGRDGRLHLFVATLQHLGSGPPDPASTAEERQHDRLRYAQLRVLPRRDGELTWISERPTVLTNSDAFDPGGTSIPHAEAGAAFVPRHRSLIRLYYPDGRGLTFRSLTHEGRSGSP
ncbi:MAG TPA: hypothetical protein VM557_12120 [Thermoanaerobaculia bacterium]|nr:hypothetical protein [Thermoanaerobaculia bacterium]